MWGFIIFAVVAFLGYHFLKGYLSVKKEVKSSFSESNQGNNYPKKAVPNKEPFEMSFEESEKKEGKYLVLDTETTGLPKDRYAHYTEVDNFPRIVQLAWMLFDDEFKVVSNDCLYINPGVPIEPAATKVTGITNKMIQEKGVPPMEAYTKFLKDANRAKVIVAHNLGFDLPILQAELFRNGFGEALDSHRTYCTMQNTAFIIKYNNRNNKGKNPKLSELAGWLFYNNTDVQFQGTHDAGADAALTAKCFIELFKRNYIDMYMLEPSILSGDMLKPDFKNAINQDNPFYKKKVVFGGLEEKELRTVAKEVKLLGADIDLYVGKNTNLLITGDKPDRNMLAKMRENVAEGKDARMMDIGECRRIIKQYFNGEDLKQEPNPIVRDTSQNRQPSNTNYGDFAPLSGDVLKPDFENAVNKDNPFFKKKVVLSGMDNDLKIKLAQVLKLLGADMDTTVGKRTNYLIIGEPVGYAKIEKMEANIAAGLDAKILNLVEFYDIIKPYITEDDE